VAGPLEQFTIEPIVPIHVGHLDLSYTNSALFMTIAVALVTVFLVVAMRRQALVPGRFQSLAEMTYEFVANLLDESAGHHARRYFPIIFSLFMFILFGNLVGLIPWSFTYTSHIIITFAMAGTVFVLLTLLAIFRHGARFLTFFVPEGTPIWLMPLLVPIELLSYLSRPISLSIRLFANMMAGHTMLFVFASFAVTMSAALGAVGYLAGLFPIILNVALFGLELLVAMLQAYVFTLLTCLYLHDALELH
jgi:F-type H+-transporting ATPase subunit a